ncbi:MAG: Phage shock protein C, PspC [Parcubacteria group bacterium GW2011_GWA2_43_11]|nr:MAG: Phage shock protein C, PspC [Parcubacteria group bacterium GW2011_GWC2_42_11]KKS85192.1 MAG: Phage shock protein C, PspC [Parcubacteria group bacterium GW2011_GWA2_43_11]
MKKVTSITLGGFVFAIEDNAYEKLSEYLSAIEHTFSGNSDYSEISLDIENAIAEKFTRSGKSEKHAVSVQDVEHVIGEMGTAEAVASEDMSSHTKHVEEPVHETGSSDTTKERRFYRDTDDVIIAGVASGIARYFDIDPVIVRVLFVISLFFNGFGFFAYIILWLIVPPAMTTAEKYAMRGNRVTIEEITEHVKKNIQKIDERKISEATRGLWATTRGFLQNIFAFLGKFIRFFFKIITMLVGLGLLLVGAFGIAGLVSAVSVIWLGESAWIRPEFHEILDTLFANPASYLFIPAILVAVTIPLLVSIILGGSLVSEKNLFTLTKGIILGVVWIVAVTLAITLGIAYQPIHIETDTFLDDGIYTEQSTIHIQGLPEEAPIIYRIESPVHR